MAIPKLQTIEPLDGVTDVRVTFETNFGVFRARLFVQQAPRTVANFVRLAEGEQPWCDAGGTLRQGRPFYDGRSFHRVVPRFVIQGGCVRGDGSGDIGYRFADEIHRGLRHDKAGILSMANAGRDTNDSQFFITLAPTPELNGRHEVFGEVIDGLEVVQAIGKLPTGRDEAPLEAVEIERVTVERR